MNSSKISFAEFMKSRPEAANAYVNGNSAPVLEMSSSSAQATFFPPNGGHVQGARAISEENTKGAKHFSPGGTSKLEILQRGESGDVSFWVGIQHAVVRMAGKLEPVTMALRVTEIFQRESNAWRLVHRHADMLAEAKPKPS